jgi:Fe-S cluster assembly iron-binding protein IscA
MLRVTKEAATMLIAARGAEGGSPTAGIRIRKHGDRKKSGKKTLAIGFAISDERYPEDEEYEENGLRMFVEEALVEPLDGRTLDVSTVGDELQLVFR